MALVERRGCGLWRGKFQRGHTRNDACLSTLLSVLMVSLRYIYKVLRIRYRASGALESVPCCYTKLVDRILWMEELHRHLKNQLQIRC